MLDAITTTELIIISIFSYLALGVIIMGKQRYQHLSNAQIWLGVVLWPIVDSNTGDRDGGAKALILSFILNVIKYLTIEFAFLACYITAASISDNIFLKILLSVVFIILFNFALPLFLFIMGFFINLFSGNKNNSGSQ